jgi:hypothetical protein
MLHAIDSRGWTKNIAWCVPTVVSFISGVPLIHSHSRAAFIQNIPLKDVSGLYGAEATLLLREQGFVCKRVDLKSRYSDAPKLKAFLNDRTAYEQCMPMMIQVEDVPNFCHMIAAHYGYAADNHTMRPVKIEDFPHINRYVTQAWVVEKSKLS